MRKSREYSSSVQAGDRKGPARRHSKHGIVAGTAEATAGHAGETVTAATEADFAELAAGFVDNDKAKNVKQEENSDDEDLGDIQKRSYGRSEPSVSANTIS
jgi:hypothetical protein